MIAADFVIDDSAAAHDTYAFTVFPHSRDIQVEFQEVQQTFPRDIKKTGLITEEMLSYLRNPMRFHFCFLVSKDNHGRDSIAQARESIDRAIKTVEGLDAGVTPAGARRKVEYLRALRTVREEAKAKRFAFGLLSNIGLFSMLSAAIMFWIVKFGAAEAIGLFPDRDGMTIGCGGLFQTLTALNFSSLCQQSGLSEQRDILMPAPSLLSGAKLFYDPLVRIPDYVAGVGSRLDFRGRLITSDHKKHSDLVDKFVSDNVNLAMMHIDESLLSLRVANVALWSKSDQRLLAPHLDRSRMIDYIAAKALDFKSSRGRRFRAILLDDVAASDVFFHHLAALVRGSAAGHPGCHAIFTGTSNVTV